MALPSTPNEKSLWDEIRGGFLLEERRDPRLIQHVLWFKNNQEYLARVLNRARPYLYHIAREAKIRKLPLELALLPAIESAFQSYAYSPGQASGLWQFIPSTGRTYGLKQNWWIDERRSPIASTRAALYFLKDMAREFNGDWLLALSAYNAGAGNVRKAIRQYREKMGSPKQEVTFWELDLPRETRGYVPRLLALARFIEEAERYNFKLPEIPQRPLTTLLDTGRQIDLSLAAEFAELPLEDLYRLNAGLNQWATPPDGPHQLLLPSSHAARFKKRLNEISSESLTGWKRHRVTAGESLSEIALNYHTTVTEIQNQNRLKGDQIRSGDTLTIPIPIQPLERYTLNSGSRLKQLQDRPRPGKRVEHTVHRGETLWDLAQQYGVSSREIARWNGMAPGDLLTTGRRLVLWLPESSPRSRPDFLEKMATRSISYRVRADDTLSEIAQQFHLSTEELMRQNQISSGDRLMAGDTLTIEIDVTRAEP